MHNGSMEISGRALIGIQKKDPLMPHIAMVQGPITLLSKTLKRIRIDLCTEVKSYITSSIRTPGINNMNIITPAHSRKTAGQVDLFIKSENYN